jgi:GntR family transcriptional regulator
MNKVEDHFSKLRKIKLEQHSPIPLYHQTYMVLRDWIVKGGFSPENTLPSEIELARSLNIGRQTVRQAMAQLVDEGLIERFSGRGTFVRKTKTRHDFFLDRSFSQEMEELGKKTSAKVLHLSLGIINENSPDCFAGMLGKPCLHLTRLRYGDDIPIGLQDATIVSDLCPGLEKHDFTRESLYRIITESYRLEIYEIFHIVNAVLATKEYAQLLGINKGDPLLLEKSVTYLSNGKPIEATTSHFRADKYEYSVRFKYMGSKKISI